MDEAKLWSAEDVSNYLGISVKTLYDWRTRIPAKGPKAKMVGRHLRYKESEVIAWFESLPDKENLG